MDDAGDLISHDAFGLVDLLILVGAQPPDLFHRHKGQQCQALFHVTVVNIAPVLVKIVGRALGRVQPQCARHGLAHLDALAVGQQREGERKSLALLFAAYQIRAVKHIAPLVVPAGLQFAAVFLIEHQKVIGLHQHIVKLQKGEPALQALFKALRRQHPVDREMHADIP